MLSDQMNLLSERDMEYCMHVSNQLLSMNLFVSIIIMDMAESAISEALRKTD